jgi:hypothetical protein
MAHVLSIRAGDLQEFARALDGWLRDHETAVSCSRGGLLAESYATYGSLIL